MTDIKTLAGIVSYHPNIKRLRENVLAVKGQVDSLVIFVNGKDSEAATKTAIEGLKGIEILVSENNQGIAFALKRIMQYAVEKKVDWFLSLDQDSICQPGLVEEYKKFTSLPNVGMLTCAIKDRNATEDNVEFNEKYEKVEDAITSGAFTKVSAYQQVKGYKESLFIDYVDFDIVYQLRRAGYMIYRINFYGLLHELGHITYHKILWRKTSTFNHSAFRQYYQARNRLYLSKEYPEYFPLRRALKAEVVNQIWILLFENHKREKLAARWHGIRDAREQMKE